MTSEKANNIDEKIEIYKEIKLDNQNERIIFNFPEFINSELNIYDETEESLFNFIPYQEINLEEDLSLFKY